MNTRLWLALGWALLAGPALAGDVLDQADDAKHMPAPGSSPLFWQNAQQIAGFRNMDQLFPTRKIAAGSDPLALPEALIDLGGVTFEVGGERMTITEYFDTQRVGGLLVVKNGRILYERYGLGNDRDTRWVSFSVAKSVVAMLYGAAIRDGYIKSVDEKVTDYLPRLKGSSYDQASIRNLLQMASGVQWNEDYADPQSDVAQATYDTLSLYEYLRHKPRDAKPGDKFNYNTAETNLAGTLLRSAIGNNLSTYLSDKIWGPYGMGGDAFWQLTEPGGGEFGGCCINATLRDYARLGLFALGDGRLADGTPVLADGWMADSVAPSKGYAGYGYFWWLNPSGSFEAQGIFGQAIHIDADSDVVIALHSARTVAADQQQWAVQTAMLAALAAAAGDVQ